MQTKKLLGIFTIVFSLMFLVGCGASTPSDAPTITDGTIVAPTDTTVIQRAIDKDQCIELMAYALKVVELQTQGDTATALVWAEKAGALQEKYIANDDDYEEACGIIMSQDATLLTVAGERAKKLK